MKKRWRSNLVYAGVIAGCLAVGMAAGWTALARQVDGDMYDWMFRLNPPQAGPARSAVLAIDDATFRSMGGVRSVRSILAGALEAIAPVEPKLVAIDLVLADAGDPAEDARLERAFSGTRNLILATVLDGGQWELPLARFRRYSAAVGEALADQESRDGVTRQIPLEAAAGRMRFWALALEAFRIGRGAGILESPEDLLVGSTLIPARRTEGRPLRVQYTAGGIPRYSVKRVMDSRELREQLRGKAVFLGVYSTTAARDRVVTPFGEHVAGLEVNAQAFETLERGRFTVDASNLSPVLFCMGVAAAAGLIFAWMSGWTAYVLAGLLLAGAHSVPFLLFPRGVVFPYFATLSSAWLSVVGAAVYQHFIVRRELENAESERRRYRQAIQFVTHEMRTPLTAIQGSSELIGRYNLNDDKRKQIAQMINSESKRLARMIQTFLDMERLSGGQVELKTEPFEMDGVVRSCLERARPLAERKSIAVNVPGDLPGTIRGDRELMEYAVYNLLTNAIKYSPANTSVEISCRMDEGQLRLAVKDEGMGMDGRELKRIFERFYRTKGAEASGEKGSGIGLSLVDEIVRHHGGRIDVTSAPGKGSCFTIVAPAHG